MGHLIIGFGEDIGVKFETFDDDTPLKVVFVHFYEFSYYYTMVCFILIIQLSATRWGSYFYYMMRPNIASQGLLDKKQLNRVGLCDKWLGRVRELLIAIGFPMQIHR